MQIRKRQLFALLPTCFVPLLLLIIFITCSSDTETDNCDFGAGDAVSTSSGFQGALYDTHAHLEESCVLAVLNTRMQTHEVSRAILFTYMNPEALEETFDDIKETVSPYANKFVPFFQIDPKQPSDMASARLTQVFDYDTNSVFKGVGEVGLYRGIWSGSSLLESPWPDVFNLVSTNGAYLMLHFPNLSGASPPLSQLGTMMTSYPSAKVLLHGDYDTTQLTSLMQAHSNLFYTLDTSVLLVLGADPIMFRGGEKAAFLEAYDQNKAAMLSAAVTKWKSLLEAFPTRVAWGSDVVFAWHTDPDVYSRLIQFSREFIAELSTSVQPKYASENATASFGNGVTF